MSYIGGAGALVLETQSATGSWFTGFNSTSDPVLGTVIGLNDDLVPSADNAFDIGTNLKRFRVLHAVKINDNSAGETLEIGNYTADTGVTAVYGQLQGKNSCWTLSADGTGSALGSLNRFTVNAGSQIYLKPSTGAVITDTDSGITLQNRSNNANLAVYPPSSGGATGGVYITGGPLLLGGSAAVAFNSGTSLSISSGTTFGVSSTANMTLTTSIDAYLTASRDMNITATTRNLTMGSGLDAYLTGNRNITMTATTGSVSTTAATNANITAGAAYGVYANSDGGLSVRNTSTSQSLAIVASSTGSTLTTAGTGNTTITLATPTVTLSNQTTATVNIAAGSASASTTTTNIGCAVAASTNTINIGRIAANDIITATGTFVRVAEHVQAWLAASTLFPGGGDHTLPSLSSTSTGNRYLTWDDTAHGFKNGHPTKALVLLVVATVQWDTSLNVRSFRWFCSAPSANHGHTYWATGDALSRTTTSVLTVTPGEWVYPLLMTTVANETVTGGTNVYNARLSLYATVI